ncbi:MAG: PQQ-binding-like beta-propeller repeat protein [Bacteroidetes bacterium]|nr:PQQ-binding-like beta-propeller repeat protein [Bacteroidota bacterium]MCL2302254.1 PQQ-binding-like beta-propeller repeat protein [Lentimicrobiaceae bacterium]
MKILKILIKSWFIFFLFSCNNNAGNDNNLNEDWSIFRGNPALTGYSNISLPDNPILLWSFKSDAYTKSSPVVYNHVAYWSNRRGRIFGINLEGKQVFDYAMETAVDAIPMVYDSILYIGRIDGKLCAISLARQDTLWTFETNGQIVASPNRMSFGDKEAIIIGSYDNYLYVIDSKNSKEINRFESGYYINGAVAQSNNYVTYGGCDGWFRVIDCVSGVQTDSLELENYIPASPAVYNNWCYIADHSGNVYEIKLDKGRITSSKKIMESKNDNSNFVSVPAVSDKMVYIVSDDRHVYAIHRKDGSIAWKYLLKGDTGESSPVICNDKLLVCTKTGIVSILDAKAGNLLWEYDTGEQILASPAVINGYFYILTFKGTLFCFGKPSF